MKKQRIYFKLFLVMLGLIGSSIISNAQIENFQVDTLTRKMLVYAPSSIVPNRPLLISMHGLNQDINYQKNQTKWELIAKENNFVVVYPGGIDNTWDLSGTKDIDFILAIIDEMDNRYAIDRERVYLSGFSMGGMMTYHAMNIIADKIAAFAPVSGYPMFGIDTNSLRPVPIIHTHGTTDDVVGYSGVSECINAWVKRNKCPETAQVTDPYPAGSTLGDTKSYWGPGTDSVEIVLISLKNKGHWHSIEDNGVNTSQEIWDFCKRFSLGYGVPKLMAATVKDANPKQIKVSFTKALKEPTKFEGFAVTVDEQAADIDTVVLIDSVTVGVRLKNSILNSNEIQVSYSNGNVLSVYEKDLEEFEDFSVDNQLYGSSPKFVELKVSDKGDTLIAKFNKKMHIPADLTTLALKAVYDGEIDIPISKCEFLKKDSTTLVFPLGNTVYADYALTLDYSGTNIASSDNGLLKTFTGYSITNESQGLPAHIVSAVVDQSAIALVLEFNKQMYMTDDQIDQITLKVNGTETAIKEVFNVKNTIIMNLFSNIYYGDAITITYTPGDIVAADKGTLDAFTDIAIENPIEMPTYAEVPGKVEAENYAMEFGTDTETTSDTGGGMNVGWTETDDWLVYAIENNSDLTEFKIKFRLAAASAGPNFDYYIDDNKIGQISVPSTGDWQIFTDVIADISVPKGKHFLKFVVVNGGFNINYFDIQEDFASSIINKDKIHISPNPASNKIVIESAEFLYNYIEIVNSNGKIVYKSSVEYMPELQLPIKLKNGSYFIKISNGESIISQQIEIIK